MSTATYRVNLPTTKYKYRLPIAVPASPNPALTDFMELTIVAPKAASTGVGTLSLQLEVKSPKIDRGGGSQVSLTNVEISFRAQKCTMVNGTQSPGSGTIQGSVVTWTHASLTSGDVKNYSVDFTWPFSATRNLDCVLSATEIERPGYIASVRVLLP